MELMIATLGILAVIAIWLLVKARKELLNEKDLYNEALRRHKDDVELKRAKELSAKLNRLMGGRPWEN